MTIVELSKKRLIEAILSEPLDNLKHGVWVDYDKVNLSGFDNIKMDCPVCAVGAVMRNILDEKSTLRSIYKAADASVRNCGYLGWGKRGESYAEVLAKVSAEDIKNHPMAALSQGFEGCCNAAEKRNDFSDLSRDQKYRIRKALVSWIKKKFPAKMLININGANPAKDVTVYC